MCEFIDASDVVYCPPSSLNQDYSVAIPAHQYAADATRFSWQAVSGKLSVNRQGQVTTAATWPGMDIEGKDGVVRLQGVRMDMQRQRELWNATSRAEMERLTLTGTDGANVFVLRGFVVYSELSSTTNESKRNKIRLNG